MKYTTIFPIEYSDNGCPMDSSNKYINKAVGMH